MSLSAVIVDDSVEFLRAARCLLEREGIVVAAAVSSGAEALRSAVEHDPDVMLVDVGLGDESGFDLADQLERATGGRARVVLISAHSELDLRDLIEASPAIGFVPKSLLSAEAITALLDGCRPGPG